MAPGKAAGGAKLKVGKNEASAVLPAPKAQVSPDALRRRAERVRGSALRAAVWFAPPFFLAVTLLALVVNRSPDRSLVEHVLGSLASGACATAACSAAIWLGFGQMAAQYGRNMEALARQGRLVKARRGGPPAIYGGSFMRYTIGGVLGAIWEPLAPRLDKQLPIYQMAYIVEIDGREIGTCELFYGDEAVLLEEDGTAWAFVDPKAPHSRRWLLRERGELQDRPFLARPNGTR
jgi:hypothetical protein